MEPKINHGDIIAPVSYTHLDVYKRQEEVPFAEENTYITVSGVVKDKQNRRTLESVSYTHLDVYKRQGMDGRNSSRGTYL